jgi:adenylate cyclase
VAREETYIRRLCVVLLADFTGYGAVMDEDDERSTRALERLQSLTHEIVAGTGGQTEPVAGDATLATFESAASAVEAALCIQRRLAEEERAGWPLRVGVGVHYGEVIFRGAAVFGEAIIVAARLQALARPGTICVSKDVERYVRGRPDVNVEDLGRQGLKDIPEPVQAYLLVPEPEADGWAPPRRLLWVIGTAVGIVAAVLGTMTVRRYATPLNVAPQSGSVTREPAQPSARTEDEGRIALGVMLFKPVRDDPASAWMREVLRDGLNTQLSALSSVKVYSKEFIDFLITRQGLSEYEAASRLGIKKMLSGSFVVVEGTVRIEMHIVDVASGVLEGSYTTVGREQDFLELPSRVAFDAIARLRLPVTPQEREALLAQRSTDVEALKRLLEAEGGGAEGPSVTPRDPGSSLPRWLARLMVPAVAQAEDNVNAEILAVLERYRQATEARAIGAVAALYAEFTAEQRAAQQRYFENVRDLRVGIENVDIAVLGDEAVATFTRTDDFLDARTGRAMHLVVRLTKIFRRHEGAWKLAAGK